MNTLEMSKIVETLSNASMEIVGLMLRFQFYLQLTLLESRLLR